MRVAVVGKGGVGKSALSTLLIRAMLDAGQSVLAMDLDRNPGLEVSLGITLQDTRLPIEAVQPRPDMDYGWALAESLTPDEAVHRYAVEVQPGLRFLGLGNMSRVEHGLSQLSTAIFQIWSGFDDRDSVLVADMEAGPTTTFEGWARSADVVLVLTRGTPASMLAAQRLLSILNADGTETRVIAVGVTDEAEKRAITNKCGPPFAFIPFDPAVRLMERTGSLAGLPPTSPARVAADALARRLLQDGATGSGNSASSTGQRQEVTA